MRKPFLALLPATWLTLASAAPPSLTDLAECRLDYPAMRAAVATAPVDRVLDESKAPHRAIANYYKPRPTAYGIQVASFGSTDMRDDESERYMIIIRFAAPFDQVRAGVVKVHGEKACPLDSDGKSCFGKLRDEANHVVNLIVVADTQYVSVGCAYRRGA